MTPADPIAEREDQVSDVEYLSDQIVIERMLSDQVRHWIIKECDDRGWNQEYMAARLGWSKSKFNKVRNGKVHLHLDMLERIVALFDMEPIAFLNKYAAAYRKDQPTTAGQEDAVARSLFDRMMRMFRSELRDGQDTSQRPPHGGGGGG